MRTRKQWMAAAAALMVLAGCSNDENMYDGPVEIRLSSGIEVQTRATHNLDTQLGDGEQVHVWVNDATTGDALYENNVLTKGSGGVLSGTTMYFPQTGNNVNIYALHGNVTLTGDAYPEGTALTHTVAADQRSSAATAGAGYQGSDLVYAKIEDQSRTRVPQTTVTLNFHHLLSKVEVVLIQGQGDGNFLNNISSLQVLNTLPTAGFTLKKAGADYGKNAERTDGIEVTASGTATPILLDIDVSPADASTDESDQVLNEAIIVPQTVNSGIPFIQVNLTDGAEFIYNLANTTQFESGKKYTYIITVRETGLEVQSQISDWTEGTGDDDGYAQEVV